MIKKFSAFARIKELEMFKSTMSPEKIKEEIVSLGLENKIVTKHTSLIAIDLEGDNVIQRSMDLVKINTVSEGRSNNRSRQSKGKGGVLPVAQKNSLNMLKKKSKKEKGDYKEESKEKSKSRDSEFGGIEKMSRKKSGSKPSNKDSIEKEQIDSKGSYPFDDEDEMDSLVEVNSLSQGPPVTVPSVVRDADIIGIQKSNGSWLLSDLVIILSWDSSKVEGANPCPDIIIWTTALALCYLEKKFTNSKDLWENVAKKAITFIRKECRTHKCDYDTIIQQGNKFIDEL